MSRRSLPHAHYVFGHTRVTSTAYTCCASRLHVARVPHVRVTHRPNIGRCDRCHLDHSNAPLYTIQHMLTSAQRSCCASRRHMAQSHVYSITGGHCNPPVPPTCIRPDCIQVQQFPLANSPLHPHQTTNNNATRRSTQRQGFIRTGFHAPILCINHQPSSTRADTIWRPHNPVCKNKTHTQTETAVPPATFFIHLIQLRPLCTFPSSLSPSNKQSPQSLTALVAVFHLQQSVATVAVSSTVSSLPCFAPPPHWLSPLFAAVHALQLNRACVRMSDTARSQPWRPPGRGSGRAKSGGGGWREAEPPLRNQM